MTGRRSGVALTHRQRSIALWILGHLDGVPDVGLLVAQVDHAEITDGSTATFLDLEVPREMPRSAVADGPLPLSPSVIGESGEIEGELLLFVADGLLSALEHAWFTDVAPVVWPDPARFAL